jgi:hypothetical protein
MHNAGFVDDDDACHRRIMSSLGVFFYKKGKQSNAWQSVMIISYFIERKIKKSVFFYKKGKQSNVWQSVMMKWLSRVLEKMRKQSPGSSMASKRSPTRDGLQEQLSLAVFTQRGLIIWRTFLTYYGRPFVQQWSSSLHFAENKIVHLFLTV